MLCSKIGRNRVLSKPQHQIAPLPAGHPCEDCHVRPISFCRRLPPATLCDLRARGIRTHLKPGQPLFFEGDKVQRVFMLSDGSLKLYALLGDGRRQITGFMFPGDFLGISMDDEHAFSAEALTEAELWAFTRAHFTEFCDQHPEVERELYRLAAHELAAAQQQMMLLGRKNAAERLASFLLMLLSRRERVSGETESLVDLAMSRIDIADYLGLTKETVSRMIAHLRDRRFIRLANQDRVEILDRDGMTELAAGFGDE